MVSPLSTKDTGLWAALTALKQCASAVREGIAASAQGASDEYALVADPHKIHPINQQKLRAILIPKKTLFKK